MKFFSAFVALPLALSPFVSALPLHDDSPALEERQSSIVITSGASNGVKPRFEIRQLQSTKPNQWILFLLAMQQWQQGSQNAPFTTSYFGIAKIHGVPEANYNNVGQCSSCPQGQNIWGYCTHGNVLFPAWHRAYMALFEQEFLKIVQSLVPKFPASRQAVMQNAANQLRFPYFDWAALPPNNGPVFPTSMSSPTISVDGPSGQQTIANPLYQITINNPSQMLYGEFVTYKTTLRYPTGTDANAKTQEQKTINAMNANRASRQQQVYQILTGCKNYLSFATHSGGSNGGCTISLESIHDNVHNDIGGIPDKSIGTFGGHMAVLPEAAFDPAFWLHHAMVDRIFALWQTLNPNLYGASQAINDPNGAGQTWTIPTGSTQGPDSNLTPFYKDNGKTFWTTNLVRDWSKTFNYTYPEFSTSDGSASAIMNYVNKLYGPSATATAGSVKRTAIPDPSVVDSLAAEVTSLPAKLTGASAPVAAASQSQTYEWAANIKTTHFALDGNYVVWVFTGTPASEDPQTWISDASYAGAAAFLMAARVPMSGRINNDTTLVTSSVPLNSALKALISAGKLGGLDPAVVTPFLTQNLKWRVSGPTGENVHPNEVAGLLVAASSTLLETPENESAKPKWSGFQIIPAITKNRAGGLNHTASWNATTVGGIVGNMVTGVLGHL